MPPLSSPLPSRKQILVSVVLVGVIYIVLILPWPGVRQAYRSGYRFVASLVLGRFGESASVRYGLLTAQDLVKHTGDPEPAGDLVAAMERRRTIWEKVKRPDGTIGARRGTDVTRLRMVVPTGRVGFVPTIELMALVLASPVMWSRKRRALVWGLLLVNAFVILRLGVFICYHFTIQPALRLSEPGPITHAVLSFSYEFLFFSPTCSFLVPVIIWIAVTFRRGDWPASLGSPSARDSSSHGVPSASRPRPKRGAS